MLTGCILERINISNDIDEDEDSPSEEAPFLYNHNTNYVRPSFSDHDAGTGWVGDPGVYCASMRFLRTC